MTCLSPISSLHQSSSEFIDPFANVKPYHKTKKVKQIETQKGYKMSAMPGILYKHFSVRLVSLLLHGSFLAFDWFQIISSLIQPTTL